MRLFAFGGNEEAIGMEEVVAHLRTQLAEKFEIEQDKLAETS